MMKPIKSDKKELTEEQKKKLQEGYQKHFNKFKKRMRLQSKSELIAVLWEQGMQFKKLQDIAKDLYEENNQLKGNADETLTETDKNNS